MVKSIKEQLINLFENLAQTKESDANAHIKILNAVEFLKGNDVDPLYFAHALGYLSEEVLDGKDFQI